MKNKSIIIASILVLSLMIFAGCGGNSNFAIIVNEDMDLQITAENATEDMFGSTGVFTVDENDSVLVEPDFEEGKVLVEFFPANGLDENADPEDLTIKGDPAFDVEISGTEPIKCKIAAGEYMVSAKVLEKANGTAILTTEK